MPVKTLFQIFPTLPEPLAVSPEDLGAIVLEILPSIIQNNHLFHINHLVDPMYQQVGPAYPQGTKRQAILIFSEALAWLTVQGLVMQDPEQPTGFFRPTRRCAALRTRVDVDAYARGRVLPNALVPDLYAGTVVPLFRRGDYRRGSFPSVQGVRSRHAKRVNAKGAGYPDNYLGVDLMPKAFHPDNGPLTDTSRVYSEREAEMHLFSGAIGHAKNPPGHRDFEIGAEEAAKLIIFRGLPALDRPASRGVVARNHAWGRCNARGGTDCLAVRYGALVQKSAGGPIQLELLGPDRSHRSIRLFMRCPAAKRLSEDAGDGRERVGGHGRPEHCAEYSPTHWGGTSRRRTNLIRTWPHPTSTLSVRYK